MTAGECGSRTGWCWPLVSLSTFQQVSLSGKDGRAGSPSPSPRRVLKYMSREIVRNIYSWRARSLHRIPLLPLVNLNSQKIKLILHLHKILLSIGKIGSNRSLKGHAFMSLGTNMGFFFVSVPGSPGDAEGSDAPALTLLEYYTLYCPHHEGTGCKNSAKSVHLIGVTTGLLDTWKPGSRFPLWCARAV